MQLIPLGITFSVQLPSESHQSNDDSLWTSLPNNILHLILILQYSFVTLVTNARVTNASPEVDQFEEVLRNLPLLVLELILYLCD